MPVRWLDNVEPLYKSIYTSSTRENATPSSVTTLDVAATHCGYIKEDAPTTAYNNSSSVYLKSKTGENRHILMQFPVNTSVTPAYTWDSLVSCNLKLYIVSDGSTSGSTDFVASILPLAPDDATCTWENRKTGKPWIWGDGGNWDKDNEAPQVEFTLGASTPTGAYYDVDISTLWMYAVEKGLSTLNLIIWGYYPTGTLREFQIYSNEGNANDVKIEVKTATARKAYWQKYNYLKVVQQPMTDPQFQYDFNSNSEHIRQPHVNQYGGFDNLHSEIAPWQTKQVTDGNLIAWNNKLTSSNDFTSVANMAIMHVAYIPTTGSLVWFKDQLEGFVNDMAQNCWTRLAVLWYDNE